VSAIILIRHGETDLAGKFCGHSDPGLNAVGEQLLSSLAEKIEPLGITHIFSSDLRRASQTAAALAERLRVRVQCRPGLREVDFGVWEGLNWEEVELQYPREARLWLREFPVRPAPGGEAYGHFVARVEAEFTALFDLYKGATPAVVTHRGVMRYVLTRFFGFSQDDATKQTANYGSIVVATPSSLPEVDRTGVRV
jgi:broad specificity phosphatase PhoE